MKSTIVALGWTILLVPTLLVSAQETKISPEIVVYKVEFNLRDGNDAAAKAGRRYTMLVDTTGKGTFRVGNRVPVATGSFQPGSGTNALVSTQFTYVDVGVNIECWIREANGRVGLRADFDVSTIVQPDKAALPIVANPIIGQLKINVDTLLNSGKPTVVASIDDPVTLRKFDVEATVTRVN
jgi:hypothetical protein